jgi:cholesterol transport system auxiliary component
MRAAAMVLGVSLLATACQNIIPGSSRDPPRLYELTPKSTFPKTLPRINKQLIIETPHASSGLQSSRIAVKVRRTTLDYYERSEWTDLAPNLVQTLLIESFDNSRRIIAVGREGSGLRADYVLKTELREFQAQLYNRGVPEVHIRLNAKLVAMPRREIVASSNFGVTIKSKGPEIDKIIATFDDALGKILKRTVTWTILEIHKRSARGRAQRGG